MSNDTLEEANLAVMSLAMTAGARIMFLNHGGTNGNIVPACHTPKCIPVIRDNNKREILSKILNDDRWNTVTTHNPYGENGDPQKVWIFETVTKMLKSTQKLYVLVHVDQKCLMQNKQLGGGSIHVDSQHSEMVAAFRSNQDLDLLKESYGLHFGSIDTDRFQTIRYSLFRKFHDVAHWGGRCTARDILDICIGLIGKTSKAQEDVCEARLGLLLKST